MIKAGEFICFAKAHKVTDPYYYIPHEQLVLAVAKNHFGNYKVYDKSGKHVVELVEKPKTKNGLLVKAKVRVNFSDKRSRTFTISNENRICPECYDNEKMIQYLPANMGFYDTYIIGVLGRPEVGKSAWIDSACRELTQREGSHMYLANKGAEEIIKYKVTQLHERKELVREILVHDKKGKVCGEILLNDTPGEFLTLSKESRGEDHEYFDNYVDLCDAFVYVVDKGDGHPENLNWTTFLDEKTPVAVVMSKADRLESETAKNDGVFMHEDIPLLTSKYFKNRRGEKAYTLNQLIENQVVDKYVLRALCPSLGRIDSAAEDFAYFAVSAGVPVEDDGTVLDLTENFNVMAPIVFLKEYLGV